MPITTPLLIFNQQNVDVAPTFDGVYSLVFNQDVIYYGKGESKQGGVRARLQSHFRGSEGSCTKSATHFQVEQSANPTTRERDLLQEYRIRMGRLPRCNDVMPK